ncbi:hypothetical protein [Vibrio sp. ABG19]|uniref:hypothetical protein n=1 Tax=Vibrio sp. ABG19 TaxID=2817385 RepID=UPI00249F6EB3|nr:hypothetical protein [Vibrio sp. ABG19]WGY47445.1 hypothetical protein J0X00_07185 [Vibrio sp. ABG19]
MKKLGMTVALLSLSAGAYAQQDPNLKVGLAVDQQLSAVLEVNNQYRFTLGNQGAAFDYIAKRGSFNNPDVPFDWYVGVGGWAEWDDDFGARVPLGLDWQINQNLNVYGQVHPELQLHNDTELQLGAALGVTYRF